MIHPDKIVSYSEFFIHVIIKVGQSFTFDTLYKCDRTIQHFSTALKHIVDANVCFKG